ncbi:MAG: sulfate transporter [Betaproteobacteria bacterium RIFCSPLOWO2_02_FULL_63_19]|nr:MAG: sulfate transporter [Betaproteobacteria bacterium RIFCSPLOWO2_02_FULL_63_19]
MPFVVAYVSILKMDPVSLLLGFGAALVAAGWYYRTPFPVQPMKAIGAAAVTQTVGAVALTPAMVVGAGLATGVIWLFLGATGLAKRLSLSVPRPALLGVVMGLGFSFMLEGIRMMSERWALAAGLLTLTLVLIARSRIPAMVVLLLAGAVYAVVEQPALASELARVSVAFRLPAFAWPSLGWQDIWMGALVLALPQLPLTFGNALVAISDENNRLFPDRPVTERKVALSTGILNLWSSALGGIPMCHGAGGMAGHVKFGARTGGASIMLGALLLLIALFLGDSAGTIFRLFPPPLLGVILFLSGAELAMGSRDPGPEKVDRFVVLGTAAFAVLNVGIAVIFGIVAYYASRRGWLRA